MNAVDRARVIADRAKMEAETAQMLEAEKREARKAEALRLRGLMPNAYAIVDEFAALFGPGIKPRYLHEHECGLIKGRMLPEGVPFHRPEVAAKRIIRPRKRVKNMRYATADA